MHAAASRCFMRPPCSTQPVMAGPPFVQMVVSKSMALTKYVLRVAQRWFVPNAVLTWVTTSLQARWNPSSTIALMASACFHQVLRRDMFVSQRRRPQKMQPGEHCTSSVHRPRRAALQSLHEHALFVFGSWCNFPRRISSSLTLHTLLR